MTQVAFPPGAIHIDGFMAHHGGIGQHVLGLLEGLQDLAEELPPLVAHVPRNCTVPPPLLSAPALPGRLYGFRRRVHLPVPRHAALMHYPHWNTPRFRGSSVPTVATIHDLTQLRVPEVGGSFLRRAYIRNWIQDTIRNADAIVTGSHHAREDIAEEFNLDPQSITVIGNGISESWQPFEPAQLADRLNRLSLTAPYLVLTGNGKAHKNVAWAARHIAQWLDQQSLPHHLIVAAGISGIQEISPRIQPMGWFHRADHRAVIQGATAVVMPSLYEGFGLPIIEAQALGVPVVCSNAASLPEVSGGPACAALFHPESSTELHTALVRILDPIEREEILPMAHANASLYTWDRVARRLVTVWQEFL